MADIHKVRKGMWAFGALIGWTGKLRFSRAICVFGDQPIKINVRKPDNSRDHPEPIISWLLYPVFGGVSFAEKAN